MKAFFVSIAFAFLACFTTSTLGQDEPVPADFYSGPFDTDYENGTFKEPACQAVPMDYMYFPTQKYWVKPVIHLPLPCLHCHVQYHWHGQVYIWIINSGSTPWTVMVNIWFRCGPVKVHKQLWFTVPPGCMFCYRVEVYCWIKYVRWGTKVLRLVAKTNADKRTTKTCDQVMGRIRDCVDPAPPLPKPQEGCVPEGDIPEDIKSKTKLFAKVQPQIMRPPWVMQGVQVDVQFWVYFWIWNPFARNVTIRITCTVSATGETNITQPAAKTLVLPPKCYYYISIHHSQTWTFNIPIIQVLTKDVVQEVDVVTDETVGDIGDGCDANLIRASLLPPVLG